MHTSFPQHFEYHESLTKVSYIKVNLYEYLIYIFPQTFRNTLD